MREWAEHSGWTVQGWKNKRAGWFFFVLKAHRGPKNGSTDKSWVSFEKFRKFSTDGH